MVPPALAKGFDIDGVEGKNIVPMLEAAIGQAIKYTSNLLKHF